MNHDEILLENKMLRQKIAQLNRCFATLKANAINLGNLSSETIQRQEISFQEISRIISKFEK